MKDVQLAVAPQHGRLDRQSVQRPETRDQSRKSRYLVEDGVWRGLQVFQLHRRLQDCPFWESWLHTPDFHAHALVQVSGHSPDLDFLCLVKCLSPVQSSLALCWTGLAHKQRARISERQRGSDGGGAGHLLLLAAACVCRFVRVECSAVRDGSSVAILFSGSYTGTRQSWSTEKYLEPWKSRSVSSMDYEIWSTKQQSESISSSMLCGWRPLLARRWRLGQVLIRVPSLIAREPCAPSCR